MKAGKVQPGCGKDVTNGVSRIISRFSTVWSRWRPRRRRAYGQLPDSLSMLQSFCQWNWAIYDMYEIYIYLCTFVCCIYNIFIYTDVHSSHTQIFSCFCVTSSVVPSAFVKISLRKSSVQIFSKLVSSLVTPCCYQYCNQAVLLGLLICLLSAPMLEREILVSSGEQLRTIFSS